MKPQALFVALALAGLFSTQHASAVYSPQIGRWLSRDPAGEPGFELLQRTHFLPGPENGSALPPGRLFNRDPYGNEVPQPAQSPSALWKARREYLFVGNAPVGHIDYLGLWVVCCRAGDPEPDDPSLTQLVLPYIRHCEIQENSCPDSKWSSYPITVSKTGQMDNGKCCNSVTPADISACLKRHPYSAGTGRPGSNCQTSVIKSLAYCCLKSTWDPSWYAGDTRGECVEWDYKWIMVRDGEGGSVPKRIRYCKTYVTFPILQQCTNPMVK